MIFLRTQRELRRQIKGSCQTLLDVGCGISSPVRSFGMSLTRSVGVDAFLPAIEQSRAAGIHDEYCLMDALDIRERFGKNSFDCVLAVSVIEHLEKQDGVDLLEQMEEVARNKTIVVTPVGFLPQSEYEGNPLQRHLSGWEVQEMRKRGYRVDGAAGWRSLRGERAEIVKRPRPLWWTIAIASQLVTYYRPERAFKMLCIKDLG